mmetsp:Transcript_52648/g.136319  ORF Transcript_52648/g.136319 Transcript_52648/m.136319 type:complete len:265 (-) Transcript_52648:207-1001(-)
MLMGSPSLLAEGYMEFAVVSGVGASVAWLVYTTTEGFTLLEDSSLPVAVYDLRAKGTNAYQLAIATLIGVVGGLLGTVWLVVGAIFKKAGDALRDRLNRLPGGVLGTVLTPAIGGALLGTIAYVQPLTLGDGSEAMKWVVGKGIGNDDVGLILGILGLKVLATSISLGFGFVGGQIFPGVFLGVCAGVATCILIPSGPKLVFITCFMSAVPSSFVPAPITFTALVIISLAAGTSLAAPIFVSGIVSYMCCAGLGHLQALKARDS